MRYKKIWLTIPLALMLFLSACNIGQQPEPTQDVSAIFTAAAETVQAQFSSQLTQTALAAPTATIPPTSTPVPTFAVNGSTSNPGTTPIATFGIGTQSSSPLVLATITPISALATQGETCYNSAFIADVTYPDGTAVKQDDWLKKIWKIQNTGTCTWDEGFSLKPVTGDAKGSWDITAKKDFVKPDETVDIAIEIKTPSKSLDSWGGCWKMMGDNGYYFGTFLCLDVKVQ